MWKTNEKWLMLLQGCLQKYRIAIALSTQITIYFFKITAEPHQFECHMLTAIYLQNHCLVLYTRKIATSTSTLIRESGISLPPLLFATCW